jgi:hypothetical protein
MASSSPSEHEIQQRIRLACGRGLVRLRRNNTGALVDPQGRLVRFGLCKGSSDLIGLRSLEITPELIGQQLAQFVALVVKTAQGVLSPEQRAFLRLLQELGGVAATIRREREIDAFGHLSDSRFSGQRPKAVRLDVRGAGAP